MSERWVQLEQAVTCDAAGGCGHVFTPRVRVRSSRVGGEDWMFRCPRCQRRYDMVHITARGVEVRGELDRVRADAEMTADVREARIAELQDELTRETTRGSEASEEVGDERDS